MTCFQQSDVKIDFRRWSGILNHCVQASKLSKFKTSSISVSKIQIFKFRKIKRSYVWGYDKCMSTLWKKATFTCSGAEFLVSRSSKNAIWLKKIILRLWLYNWIDRVIKLDCFKVPYFLHTYYTVVLLIFNGSLWSIKQRSLWVSNTCCQGLSTNLGSLYELDIHKKYFLSN